MSKEKNRIEEMITPLYEQGINFLMSDKSPIDILLKVALTCHTTPQCKIRSTIEGLYSWSKFSKVGFYIDCKDTKDTDVSIYIPNDFYLELSECLIQYANLVFNNKIEVDFYRDLILGKWLDFSANEFPYLVMDVNDRVKSLASEINDLVDKTLKRFICKGLLEKAELIFEEKDLEETKTTLRSLARNYSASRNKDIYGLMFVVEYYDRIRDSDDPEYLKMATLKLGENALEFFKQNNIKILSVKDFITNPKKGSNYCSYQFVIVGFNSPFEIQFKSLSMHNSNEDPESTASHKRYKDKPFNNHLNGIVDELYGVPPVAPKAIAEAEIFKFEMKRDEILNNRLGITEGIPLFGVSRIHRTPNGEIPKSLNELESFEKMELLAELYAKYHE